MDFIAAYYFWIKALHVIAVIAWMAGMLYLPRLYVYHAAEPAGSAASETFKIMERRLLRAIMNPAAVTVLILGGLLIAVTGAGAPGTASYWLHAKLVLVVCLFGLHGYFASVRKDFEHDRNTRSPKHFKIINEIVTVLMVAIVILAEVKPF